MKALYTAKVDVLSGRDGSIKSEDGQLEHRLAFPKALGGDGNGTNPEQLFAAGYAACFGSTLAAIGKAQGTPLGAVSIHAEVDMLHDAGTYDLAVRLEVRAEKVDRQILETIIDKAKQACPYARATRSSLASTIVVAPDIAAR